MKIIEQWISVQGVRTHLYQAGDSGAPLVLLHGGGADSAKLSWEEVIAPLAESGLRVFAPDLPGSGDSQRPDLAYTIPYFVDFIGELLSVLNLDRASLMGLSLGGSIALGVALRWPARVERLVLVDSYGLQRKVTLHFLSWLMVRTPGLMESSWIMARASRETSRWLLSSIFHNPKAISPALLDEALAEARKPYPGRSFTRIQRDEVLRNGLRTVYLDRLGEIQAPTLIVHGREDIAVPLACAEEAQRRLPNARLHVIPGAGHWPQREKPQEFIETVTAFFSH